MAKIVHVRDEPKGIIFETPLSNKEWIWTVIIAVGAIVKHFM